MQYFNFLPIQKFAICLCVGLSLLAKSSEADEGKTVYSIPSDATSLPQAHAHNDYAHPRPLMDALANGFCSVEVDVFLVDGKLLVAHEVSELDAERTLESLYLAPLREIVRINDGRVYKSDANFQLLIDIKSDGESTYKVLDGLLAKYQDMLTEVSHGVSEQRAITVVISGNRPIDAITKQAVRFAGIDGRLSDLDSKAPSHLLPLISDRWTSHFKWRGSGTFPKDEQDKLKEIVIAAHQADRKVRFWATPDNEGMWKALRDANVDYINTDDLSGLAEFLK